MDEPRHHRDLIDHYDCHQHEVHHAPDPVSYTHLDVYKRQCHILPDWLLIYRIEDDVLVLTLARTGSHSDLFGK